MANLIFTEYSRIRMAERHLPEAAIYHVVEDADEVIVRDDGRIDYISVWEGLTLLAVIEDDGEAVVTFWGRKQRRPRR